MRQIEFMRLIVDPEQGANLGIDVTLDLFGQGFPDFVDTPWFFYFLRKID